MLSDFSPKTTIKAITYVTLRLAHKTTLRKSPEKNHLIVVPCINIVINKYHPKIDVIIQTFFLQNKKQFFIEFEFTCISYVTIFFSNFSLRTYVSGH